MPRRVFFHERPGQPSPRAYIKDRLDPSDRAELYARFDHLALTDFADWPPKWKTNVVGAAKLLEMHYGDHRIIYFVTKEAIVIVHALLKKGQKLGKRDIDLALRRMEDYRVDH
jgi:phage-related protein